MLMNDNHVDLIKQNELIYKIHKMLMNSHYFKFDFLMLEFLVKYTKTKDE